MNNSNYWVNVRHGRRFGDFHKPVAYYCMYELTLAGKTARKEFEKFEKHCGIESPT